MATWERTHWVSRVDAGVPRSAKSIERGATAYLARDVLDLITLTERALASTKFDTRASAPNRPVPARPRE